MWPYYLMPLHCFRSCEVDRPLIWCLHYLFLERLNNLHLRGLINRFQIYKWVIYFLVVQTQIDNDGNDYADDK